MNRFTLFFICLTSLLNAQYELDRDQAKKAFQLINNIRMNTEKYRSEYKFLRQNEVTHTKLKWNETLAKVAEAKAIDMVKRKYFNHVNPDGVGINYLIHKAGYKINPEWFKDKKTNYFESISAGSENAAEAIRRLIVDKNDPRLGHRIHLLGLDDWNASLVDIGIAFIHVPKSEYKTYMVIIIAKHDW